MLRDILLSGRIPMDRSILKAEMGVDHRVKNRLFVLNFIKPKSVGAELGVFTGLFSSRIARHPNLSRVTFVDPWWTLYGDYYPDWGRYTDFGRLKTRAAYAAAKRRVLQHRMPNRFIEVTSSYDWLAAQADESLDWVYLDSTHSYDGTKQELALIKRKLKHGGLILGDDWVEKDPHQGVFIAVNEFLKDSDFKVVICGRELQWALRKNAIERSSVTRSSQ
jgi:SAM-dependent methyltransferase